MEGQASATERATSIGEDKTGTGLEKKMEGHTHPHSLIRIRVDISVKQWDWISLSGLYLSPSILFVSLLGCWTWFLWFDREPHHCLSAPSVMLMCSLTVAWHVQRQTTITTHLQCSSLHGILCVYLHPPTSVFSSQMKNWRAVVKPSPLSEPKSSKKWYPLATSTRTRQRCSPLVSLVLGGCVLELNRS